MPWIGRDVESRHLLVGHTYRLGIAVLIEFTAHGQAGFRGGGGDEIDDREPTDEWLAASILGDVAEHAMLDLVPLRCPWRIVAYLQDQPGLVGEFL